MQIQNIGPQTFERKHFIPDATKDQMHTLLNKMNEKAIYQQKGNNVSCNLLRTLSLEQEKASFVDERFLTKYDKDNFSGYSVLKFAKTTLFIDNKTGEILEHRKPLFKTWKSVLKEASNTIKLAFENFNNKNILIKKYWTGTFDIEKDANL